MYQINEQKIIQDSERGFWTWQNMALEVIECYGIHNLPNSKSEARSLFNVNYYFGDSTNFEISDETAEAYLIGEGRGKRGAIREVKARIKRELKRYFINERERKLDEIYVK